MSQAKANLPAEIEEALEATGLPWHVEMGGRHKKIRLAGRMVGVVSFSGTIKKSPRATWNLVAQIRRAARELKNG